MKEQDGAAAVVAAGKPLKTITLGELLAWPFPDREDLVTPWLRQGESAMLWAPVGLGKTMLALTLALAVAGGGRVLGWSSPKPRPVLYVDGEMNAQDLKDRLKMLAGTVDGLDMEAAGRNLTVICRQFQDDGVMFPDLAVLNHQTVMLDHAKRAGAELVILDNFATLCEVADENEAAAMSPVLGFLLRLKQADRACILVHHSGKSGNDFRGSSKLGATFEVIIGLHKLVGGDVGDGAGFDLRWGKFRGKPSAAVRDMEVRLQGFDEAQPQWTHEPTANAEMLVLLDDVRSRQFATAREIAAHRGWDPSKVSRLRTRAVAAGDITNSEWDRCVKAAKRGTAAVNDDF